LQGVLDQEFGGGAGLGAAFPQGGEAVAGDEVFLLGGQEVRAVDVQQGLSPADGLPGGVDVEALDPALELGRDRVDPAFVHLDAAEHPHVADQDAGGHGLGPHAQLLDFLRDDRDVPGSGRLALVDRDIVHAHLVLLGRWGGVGGPHGMAVIQDAAGLAGRGSGASGLPHTPG
jgi:hypothetical protein